MDDGRWTMVRGLWSVVYGPWSMVRGLWSVVRGKWGMVHKENPDTPKGGKARPGSLIPDVSGGWKTHLGRFCRPIHL